MIDPGPGFEPLPPESTSTDGCRSSPQAPPPTDTALHRRLTEAFLAIRDLSDDERTRVLSSRDDLDEALLAQIRRLLELDQRTQLPIDRSVLEGSKDRITQVLESLVLELRRREARPGRE